MNCRSEVRGQRPEVWRVILWVTGLFLWLILQPADLRAQGQLPPATGTPGVAGEKRTVAGRVLSGSSDTLRPVSGQMVVLHRISADSSGPVDSIRTSPAGAYRFGYRLDGPRSMYIVSTRYAGVAYFTTPLREAAVTSPDADVSVYDTTSAAFPLSVRARHVVVAPADAGGLRRIVDVLEVANDSTRTLVASPTGRTWRLTLPADATQPGASGGDMPAEAFRFEGANADLTVPFPPGSRQLVITYAIPAGRTVSIPVADAVSTLEVLVEGGGGTASGAGLTREDQVSLEGRTFERYTAASVPAGSSFSVERVGGGGNAGRLALLAVAAIAVALGIIVGRRDPEKATPIAGPRITKDSLARHIAALDHVYATPERQAGTGGDHYRARRAALLDQLIAVQAVEDRDTLT